MNQVFFLFFGGFVLFAIGLGIWAWVRERRRTERMKALAASQGWRYIAKDSHGRPSYYHGFGPFGKGHTRYARHILQVDAPVGPMEAFEYHYAITTHNGKSSQTQHHYHSVCTIRMPFAAPGLTIAPEHLGHKLLDMLGGEDIDFESDAFSRRFWVRCDDRRFAYDVIHPRMMEWLLTLPKGWNWEWRGDTLMVWHKKGLSVDRVRLMTRWCPTFRDHLPRHLEAERAVPAV